MASFRRGCSEPFSSQAAEKAAFQTEQWMQLRTCTGAATAAVATIGNSSGVMPFKPPRDEAEIRARWQGCWPDVDVLTHFFKRFAPALAKPKLITHMRRKHKLQYRGQDWRKKMYRGIARQYGVDPRVLWLEREEKRKRGVRGETRMGRNNADKQAAQNWRLSALRERAQALLAKHGNDGGVDSTQDGDTQEAMQSEEDVSLWRVQMAEQAAAGNLDVAELTDVGSLPTLLKLLQIPSMQSVVCNTIATIAAAAAAELPSNVTWGQLLRPLLEKLSSQAASTSNAAQILQAALISSVDAIISWSDRCYADLSAGEAKFTMRPTERICLPAKSPAAVEVALWHRTNIGRTVH